MTSPLLAIAIPFILWMALLVRGQVCDVRELTGVETTHPGLARTVIGDHRPAEARVRRGA